MHVMWAQVSRRKRLGAPQAYGVQESGEAAGREGAGRGLQG